MQQPVNNSKGLSEIQNLKLQVVTKSAVERYQ